MKIGIKSFYLDKYGFDEGLLRMKRHGYECIDFSMVDTEKGLYLFDGAELEKEAEKIKDKFSNVGIEVSQTHGPWRFPPKDATIEDRNERFEKFSKAIKITSLLGCKYMVVHALLPFGFQSDPEPEKTWQINLDFFKKLLPIAIENNVVICLENLPFHHFSIAKPKEVLKFAKEMNSENFKCCLDTGHNAVLGGQAGEAVRLLGKDYLKVMHVHDNDGKGDLHNLPYTGVIDWEDFRKSLIEIGFDKTLSLETSVKGDPNSEGFEEKEIELCKIAKKLANR